MNARKSLGVILTALLLAAAAAGATFTWDGGNESGQWSLGGAGGNWSGDDAPAAGGAADADLVFASNANGQISTNNLAGMFRLNTLAFGPDLPVFILAGGVLSNAASYAMNSPLPVTVLNAIRYGVYTEISGTGTGRLTLAGALTAMNGAATRTLVFSGDRDVELSGTFTGNGTTVGVLLETVISNNVAPGRTLTFSGPFRLTDNANTRDLQLAGSGDTVFSGPVYGYAGGAGDGTLEIANTGKTCIVGSNVLNKVSLVGGGTLQVGGLYPLGSTLTFNGAKLLQLTGDTILTNTTVTLNAFTTAGTNALEIRGLLTSSHSGTNRLTFNNPRSILSGGVNMSSGGPSKRWFEFAGTGDVYVPSVITRGAAATVDVLINSSGAVTFAAANTYIGNTTVVAGSLRVENSGGSGTGAGNVTVRSNAVISGSGLIQGHLTLNAGARFEAGAGRPLTVSNLVVGAGCTLVVTNSGPGPVLYYTGSAPVPFAAVLGLNGRQVSYDTANVITITGSEHPGAVISIQ